MHQGWERFKVKGEDLLRRAGQIVHEGNVRHVVVKRGTRTVAEFPMTFGVVGAIAAPTLAAVGAMAALLSQCTIEVEREAGAAPRATPRAPSGRRRSRRP